MDERREQAYKCVRNFLLGLFDRKFLILFFLALSSIFWLMMTLNETYEQEIVVPVSLMNVPKNAVITTEVDSTLRVTVRDKGYTLVTYMYVERVRPIKINFATYANKNTGYGVVPAADLQKMVYQRLIGSSRIVSLNPDKVDFYFNYGLSKTVPVRMSGSVTPERSYYLARTRFWPERVTVYASKAILDSISHASTAPVRIVNFSDTVVREVKLAKIKGVKFVPSSVRMGLYPDILTEESVEVPIRPVNVPEGKALRTFPSRVNVRFIVGASMFRDVKPEQFEAVVDYNEVASRSSDKCNVYLRTSPQNVRDARLVVQQVGYLIEQQ